ncbi:hypothetical protein [Devosia elaeis]|uniref:Porin domain-containing protein n=1 Tax=Devosia elaeis TaxID=1770058 RepID=A0A178I4I7_9HYPH|nr:hypothetical protein [Devosia elaeis]OAM84254.1 hypothetical protein A3840_00330 [Devosia elaeis]
MKLKSLFLGSVAAAGLSTAGFAADLGVLTSLDVCDSLGISGLTISSSDNCLALSGGVSYEFGYGEFRDEVPVARTIDPRQVAVGGSGEDWDSRVISWVKAVGTASSDFGPASATIKLKSDYRYRTRNGVQDLAEDGNFFADEAFVQIGDTTTIMAGKKGSIANLGDDAPFNYLGLFNSSSLDGNGVGIDADTDYLGGHVIQVVSQVGNGLTVGVGLEALQLGPAFDAAFTTDSPGTLVGVVSYAGEGITAHLTAAAFEVLSGDVESWLIHAGATGTFDAFKVRAAASYFNDSLIGVPGKHRGADVFNGLVSVEGSFDLFTLALSGEVQNVTDGPVADFTDYGFGGSIGVNVTEGVAINLGARYFRDGLLDEDTVQVAAQVVAAVTETLKVTGELGGYFGSAIENNAAFTNDNIIYGAAELAWAPGGGFTSSLRGEVNSEEAYKVTFKAAKEFK